VTLELSSKPSRNHRKDWSCRDLKRASRPEEQEEKEEEKEERRGEEEQEQERITRIKNNDESVCLCVIKERERGISNMSEERWSNLGRNMRTEKSFDCVVLRCSFGPFFLRDLIVFVGVSFLQYLLQNVLKRKEVKEE
jgi:hypothetical protein